MISLILVCCVSDYAGIGVSVQASNICAIDVDHCFKSPFIIESSDDRGKDVLSIFKDHAYCEFSFSGTGLRILFRHPIIENYANDFYIKNSKNEMEFYQPGKSYRYVTITGKTIYDNPIKLCEKSILFDFLNKYMVRPKKSEKEEISSPERETRSIDQLMELVKYHYLKNSFFQEIWFSKAPGYNSDESERDYYLIQYMYMNITRDKEMLRELFESSPFFQSKDWKHKNKWEYNDHRYYNYIYDHI